MFAEEKISIIIPVYNSEAYLERCINSVLSQTYHNFEVICVDDGSTDNSGKMCDTFAKEDERVRVLHIKNSGVSHGRNSGLSVVSGEWFAYIDSDDWIEPDYLLTLFENAKRTGATVSGCGFSRDYQYSMLSERQNNKVFEFDTIRQIMHSFVGGGPSLQGMVWGKIYKRDCFSGVLFDERLKVNEDCIYTYEILKKCVKACLSTAKLYHWYMRPDSACHSRSRELDLSASNVFLELMNKPVICEDDDAVRRLKRNYTESVIKVARNVEKSQKKHPMLLEAVDRCRNYKKDIWPLMSTKQKIKYYLFIH